MRILTSLIVAMRARQLGRQFRVIERSIRGLAKRDRDRLGMLCVREIREASRCDFPHLYGTAPESRYQPWGQGTEIGYGRACANKGEVALRGIALWLAVAYHETRTAPQPSLQRQHRELLRMLCELKEAHGDKSDVDDWIQESAAA